MCNVGVAAQIDKTFYLISTSVPTPFYSCFNLNESLYGYSGYYGCCGCSGYYGCCGYSGSPDLLWNKVQKLNALEIHIF